MTTQIKKLSFKAGLPHEFEVVELARIWELHKAKLITPYRTGFYHILWFEKGNLTHLVDFNPVDIEPNTILFLNKDTVQRFDSAGNYEGKAILFTEGFFCRSENDAVYLRSSALFNDLFSILQITLTKSDHRFLNLIQLMENELLAAKDEVQSDILHNLLHLFLLFAEREKRKQQPVDIKRSVDLDFTMRFKSQVENNFRSQKQVSVYAGELGLTEKRLNQATTKVLGKTPKQVIDERVILEAMRLLAHTDISVKEIGFSLGFEEPTNFIKYFRRKQETTPLEFRLAQNR